MTWTETTRRHYRRDVLRHASDLRDEEWVLIAPYLPKAKRFGRSWMTDLRAVVDALLYILTTGCQWRMLPKCFPPSSTVQRFFHRWRADGLWDRINHELGIQVRETEGRNAGPATGIIDSQPVKTTRSGGPRGFDAGKKIKGRKRHVLTDTTGPLTAAIVHEANVQDPDDAAPLLVSIRKLWPRLRHVFADSGCAGSKLEKALVKIGRWALEIVRQSGRYACLVIRPGVGSGWLETARR